MPTRPPAVEHGEHPSPLRQAGVETTRQVYEGQSHAECYRDDRIPEVKEAFGEITSFFDAHLGR